MRTNPHHFSLPAALSPSPQEHNIGSCFKRAAKVLITVCPLFPMRIWCISPATDNLAITGTDKSIFYPFPLCRVMAVDSFALPYAQYKSTVIP